MKIGDVAVTAYVVSLGLGLLVGLLYGGFNVRSPAPPVIALIGLLGILAGEQASSFLRRVVHGGPQVVAQAEPKPSICSAATRARAEGAEPPPPTPHL